MEVLEEKILDVLDGLAAPDELMLFIYPTNSPEIYDVEMRLKEARVRFEVITGPVPAVTVVENRRFKADFVERFQSELLDALC